MRPFRKRMVFLPKKRPGLWALALGWFEIQREENSPTFGIQAERGLSDFFFGGRESGSF